MTCALLALFANREYGVDMLKPQDVLLLLKLVATQDPDEAYNRLANQLDMSPAEVHKSALRAQDAGLLSILAQRRGSRKTVNRKALEEFLLHGLRYVFPAQLGPITRGIPTGYAAPFFPEMVGAGADPVPVWPCAEGKVRGMAFSPLYRSVPQAARKDEALYKLLAYVDAIRGGRAREREIAERELVKMLRSKP
ncbi:MAG: hypothetical protein M5U26_20095 [Planctomycetota bacterium]|nr:hypothetical protein [Planctomycetota bacterium]